MQELPESLLKPVSGRVSHIPEPTDDLFLGDKLTRF
jgi:hypothetical protein